MNAETQSAQPSRDEVRRQDEARAQNPPFRSVAIGFAIWLVARCIGKTLRVKHEGTRGVADAARDHGGAIVVTWHGRTFIPANVYSGRGYWALISHSRDGEIQNQIFRRFGYQTVRGSTGRGGVRAALQLARIIRGGGVLAFTPDGPRGPSGVVQEGTIFLSERSGRPVIPIGVAAKPCRLLGTWDRYLIPMPFSRAAFVTGEPIFVPEGATDEQRAHFAETVGEAINQCQQRAEAMLNPAA